MPQSVDDSNSLSAPLSRALTVSPWNFAPFNCIGAFAFAVELHARFHEVRLIGIFPLLISFDVDCNKKDAHQTIHRTTMDTNDIKTLAPLEFRLEMETLTCGLEMSSIETIHGQHQLNLQTMGDEVVADWIRPLVSSVVSMAVVLLGLL